MTTTRRFLTLAAGYATGTVVLALGAYLFWLPDLSQEQVLLTGLPLVGGMGLVIATAEFQKRSSTRSV